MKIPRTRKAKLKKKKKYFEKYTKILKKYLKVRFNW